MKKVAYILAVVFTTFVSALRTNGQALIELPVKSDYADIYSEQLNALMVGLYNEDTFNELSGDIDDPQTDIGWLHHKVVLSDMYHTQEEHEFYWIVEDNLTNAEDFSTCKTYIKVYIATHNFYTPSGELCSGTSTNCLHDYAEDYYVSSIQVKTMDAQVILDLNIAAFVYHAGQYTNLDDLFAEVADDITNSLTPDPMTNAYGSLVISSSLIDYDFPAIIPSGYEIYPGTGSTNHYAFVLDQDWMLLQGHASWSSSHSSAEVYGSWWDACIDVVEIEGSEIVICMDPDEPVTLATVEQEGAIYTWFLDGDPMPGADEFEIEVTEAGDYTVEIEYSEHIFYSLTFTLYELPGPILDLDLVHSWCETPGSGSATVDVSNVTNYTIDWSTSGGVEDVDNVTDLAPGNYSVTVINTDNGCSLTETFQILLHNLNLNTTIYAANCDGNGNGAIVINSFDTPPSGTTYEWKMAPDIGSSDPAISTTLTPLSDLSEGDYYLFVDMPDCDRSFGPVNVPALIIDVDVSPYVSEENPCRTEAGYSLDFNALFYYDYIDYVFVNLDNPLYNYGYEVDYTGEPIVGTTEGFEPGEYVMIVRIPLSDESECMESFYLEVLENEVLIDGSTTPATCGVNDGTASISASGGESPLVSSWDFDEDGFDDATGTELTMLEAGTYEVHVEDANGCYAEEAFEVEQLPIQEASLEMVDNCHYQVMIDGLPFNFDDFGGYIHFELFRQQEDLSYVSVVSGGSPQFELLQSGNYYVVVSVGELCTLTSDPMVITVEFEGHNFEVCFRWKGIIVPETPPTPPAFTAFTPVTSLANGFASGLAACGERLAGEAVIAYQNQCLNPDMRDELTLRYHVHLEHFTLYYHDRAGNLTKTIPPSGFRQVEPGLGALMRHVESEHVMPTTYEYNSLGENASAHTPEMSPVASEYPETRVLYDYNQRVRFTQTPFQRDGNLLGYFIYDRIGRLIEMGQCDKPSGVAFEDLDNSPNITAYLNNMAWPGSGANRNHIARYTYSVPSVDVDYYGELQTNLDNRVSFSTMTETYNSVDLITTSFFSYDAHGNVKWIVQDYPQLGRTYLRYEYDLLSGNVLLTAYNEGRDDRFYHRYNYDASNRIKSVETSNDMVIWDEDARYSYYAHGPQNRLELGEDHVQGLDMIYTLNGWLKAINHPNMNSSTYASTEDPGKDGSSGNSYERDVFAMSLGYYGHDYVNGLYNADAFNANMLGQVTDFHEGDLFNGNISSLATSVFPNAGAISGGDPVMPATTNRGRAMEQSFRYDRLNRLKQSEVITHNVSTTQVWHNSNEQYKELYSYDPNGNIMNLVRNGVGASPALDDFDYTYTSETNILASLDETISGGINGTQNDIAADHTYTYNKNGNLYSDATDGINKIQWTPYGKMNEVDRSNSMANIECHYNAAGHKWLQITKPNVSGTPVDEVDWTYEYYVNDPLGNVIATYQRTNEDPGSSGGLYVATFMLDQEIIYGEDRIGQKSQDNANAAGWWSQSVEYLPGTQPEVTVLEGGFVNEIPKHLGWGFAASTSRRPFLYDLSSSSPTITQTWLPTCPLQSNYQSAGAQGTASPLLTGGASICSDANGEPMFYAVPMRTFPTCDCSSIPCNSPTTASGNLRVLDKTYLPFPSLPHSVPTLQDCQSEIVADPGDPGKYYVFYQAPITGGTTVRIYYLVIDMTLQGNSPSSSDPWGDYVSGPTLVAYSTSLSGTYRFLSGLGSFESHDPSQPSIVYSPMIVGSNLRMTQFKLLGGTVTQELFPTSANRSTIVVTNNTKVIMSPDMKYIAYANAKNTSASGDHEMIVYALDDDHNYSGTSYVSSFSNTLSNTSGNSLHGLFAKTSDLLFISNGFSLFTWDFLNTTTTLTTISTADGGKMIRGMNTEIWIQNVSVSAYTRMWMYDETNLGAGSTSWNNHSIETPNINNTGVLLSYSWASYPIKFYPEESRTIDDLVTRFIDRRQYELSDHLGNVRATVSDAELLSGTSITTDAKVLSYTNYSPYGREMPSRNFVGMNYQYSFNGQEKEPAVTNTNSHTSAEFWMYDSRIGRRWNVDPNENLRPEWSPYNALRCNPIQNIDPAGAYDTDFLNKETGETQHVEDGVDQLVIVSNEDYKRISELNSPSKMTWNREESVTYDNIVESAQKMDWDSDFGKVVRVVYGEMSTIGKTTDVDRQIVAESIVNRKESGLYGDTYSEILVPAQYNAMSQSVYKNGPYAHIKGIKDTQKYFYDAKKTEITNSFLNAVSVSYRAMNGIGNEIGGGVVSYVSPPLPVTYFDNDKYLVNITSSIKGLKGISGVWKRK